MLRKDKKALFSILFLIFVSFELYSQIFEVKNIIHIQSLSNKDVMFKQFCFDVEHNYMLLSQPLQKKEDIVSSILFYQYEATENDTFFALASRFNVGQETLATINHISNPTENIAGKKLIVPNCKALYLSESPVSAFEILLKKKCGTTEPVARFSINGEVFEFYPDYQIGMTERTFFLDSSYKMPLAKTVLTSSFGMRISPISGKPLFHRGIDLASPEGSEVYSCASGYVTRVGYDNVYGNYIEIKHSDSRRSFYAHLSKVLVSRDQFVKSSSIIGYVGVTGLTTGPHLHFEILEGNKNIDPLSVVSE